MQSVTPTNRKEVAQIISDGFKENFDILISANAIESMLARDNLNLRFKDSTFIQKTLESIWQSFNLFPNDNIFYSRFDYKLDTPPIFISHVMPHLIGFALLYQEEIGLSNATVQEAKEIAKQTAPRIAALIEQVRQLELQVFDQSITRDQEKFETLLGQLADVKKEASMVQWEAVQKGYNHFAPKEIKSIEEFLKKNRLAITTARGL